MKKLILTTVLLVISYLGFSQATPTGQFRVADRTTTFGTNLPVGTQIYCVSDSTLWEVKLTTGCASTRTITTALAAGPAELVLINRATSYTVETFEYAGGAQTFTLTQIPQTATLSLTVAVNGATLRPTTDYTSAAKIVTIAATQVLSAFDKVTISYTYNR